MNVPTREEHARTIRRIWTGFISMALAIFVITGGVVATLFFTGHDSKKITDVSTSVFQVLVLSYGLGFFVPAFLTSLIKMSLGVEMSRAALEIGQDTSRTLEEMRDEVKPLVEDAKEVVGAVRDLVKDIKDQNPRKIVDYFDKLSKDGTIDRIAASIDKVADKVHEAIQKTEARKVDDAVGAVKVEKEALVKKIANASEI